MEEIKFKLGDIVEWCGNQGEINRLDGNLKRPIGVAFGRICDAGYEYIHWFTLDGKSETWHMKPSLRLIERKPFKWTGEVTLWKGNVTGNIVFLAGKEAAHSLGSRSGTLTFEEKNNDI